VLRRTRVKNYHKKKKKPRKIGTWFVIHDQDQPKMIEIHVKLQRLLSLLHDVRNVVCTIYFLDDVEEKRKNIFHLCHHSNKLAIAFGLINTTPSIPFQIRKSCKKICYISYRSPWACDQNKGLQR
jgi:hypothetical protein